MLRAGVFGAAIGAVFLMSAPASAGDRSTNWTGLYIGAHGGYVWDDWNVDLTHSSGAINWNDPFAQPFHSLNSDGGWSGGIQAGANLQHGSIVVGIEADATWGDIDAHGRFTTPAPNYTTWDIDTSLEAFGTVRGRLGLAHGNFLFYGTGGLAWGTIDAKQATNWYAPAPPDVGGRTSGDVVHLGWSAGAGGEWAINSSWSIKAEWLYVDLGKENYALDGTTKPGGSVPYTETFATDLTFNTARVGINYKFGGRDEVVPLK